MKICIINHLYYPNERGGAEKFCHRLAQTALAEGNQVFVITTAVNEDRQTINSAPVYYLKSDFENVGSWSAISRGLWQLNNLFNFRLAKQAASILKAEKPDLVITNNLLGFGWPFLKVLAGWRHIHIIHDTQLLYPSGLVFYGQEKKLKLWRWRWYRLFNKIFTANFKFVVSPSSWLWAWHRKYGFFKQAQGAILPHPAPEAELVGHQAHRPFRLLFVGQLEDYKGVKVLLKAMDYLPAGQFSLTIAGTGSLSDWLKDRQQIQSFNYVGQVPSAQIKQLMAESDCLVMPSLVWENAPLVLSEAAAAGLPAVGSNLGGVAEMIRRPELLFTPGEPRELAAALVRLSDHFDQLKPLTTAGLSSQAYWRRLVELAFGRQK